MFSSLKILAVVPARGGSKGIPRKNIRLLGGEPLIGHTLKTAMSVDMIDDLIVSTDDNEISDVAKKYGAEVLNRPSELATDNSSTESVVIHVLNKMAEDERHYDVVLILEPTSPFRSTQTIIKTIKLFDSKDVDSVLAVRETKENIGNIENNIFLPINPKAPRRRQLRKPMYIESSTIYGARTSFLLKNKSLVSDKWTPILVTDDESIDINIEHDFRIAESFIN
jgi:CMP-N,N'-diacetyllegionaminic acid synthase